jgi:hypothetical protein
LFNSTWTLGALAAIVSWNPYVAFFQPGVGLDPSWWAAMYMAAHRGMHFGSQIVFTYGPLAFLRQAWVWYGNLGALGFVYSATLHIALAISLVWSLRRTLHAAIAVVLALLVLVAAPEADVALALAAIWCLAALSPEPPRYAPNLVLFGGAALGAIETLVELRSGPVILAICAITLLGVEHWRRRVPIFVGCSAVFFLVAWFSSGQALGNLPDFVSNAVQIVSGYSEAMGLPDATGPLTLPLTVLAGAALVAAATFSSAAGRGRKAAAAAISVAIFSLYKEAVVRAGVSHRAIFFATAAVLAAGIAFGRRRVLAGAWLAGFGVASALTVSTGASSLSFDPVTHARQAVDQVRLLLSPNARAGKTFLGAVGMIEAYHLDPATLDLLRGHTVHVDPWEAGVAWAYRLDWDPLPVIQNYSAYTAALDRLNSERLRSPHGPQRILRENTGLVDPSHVQSVDSRLPAWDPPAQAIAMLCNYVPLRTTARWQVLGKVTNRCGTPQAIGSIHTRYGQTVRLPSAQAGGVVYAKVEGAAVTGLERLKTLLYRANSRHVVVNGTNSYRLVPGTAADGLLIDLPPNIDYPAPFVLSPGARTIEFKGVSGELTIDLYWMQVRIPPAGRLP